VASLASAERKAGLAAGRRALASSIVASGILRAHRVVVMFDAARENTPSEPSPHPMLSLRFSTPPRDADAAILDLLARSKGEASSPVTVVTADSDLSWEARKLGASVVAPESWEPLKAPKGRKRRQSAANARSEKPQASAKDVDYWLGVFGDEGAEKG
jgi:predicted RNA-binding protein with PIN domain